MESYNNEASKSYNEKALDACPNCGRTFLPERLIVHLRSCNKAHGKSPDERASPNKSGFNASAGSLGNGLGGGNKALGGGSPQPN
jgi:hypothetical protein